MSEMIEQAKAASDAILGGKSRITDNLSEILKEIDSQNSGVTIEIPWNSDVSGEYMESITVVAVKRENGRLYFINPVKVSRIPVSIEESENKGPARKIESDGMESISLEYLEVLAAKSPILGIIRA